MRFAIVGPAAPLRGGIAQHTDCVVDALRAQATVDLYPFSRQYPQWLFPGRTQLAPGASSASSAQVTFDPYSRRTWTAVAKDIAAHDPDLVLIQWWHPWFSIAASGLITRLRQELGGAERIAVICHNVLPHRYVPMQRHLSRRALSGAGRWIVHAAAEEEKLRALLGGSPRIHRMPLPCLAPTGTTPSREAAREQLGIADEPLLLFFGLVRGYKGVLDLIAALPLVRDGRARLLVAGEFYEPMARYERAIEDAGAGERIVLRNEFVPASEVATLFAAADVVVIPYRTATQSSVLPLAVHYQKRFVVTDVGGLVEAAQGLAEVAPPESPSALAAAIDRALAAGAVEETPADVERWQEASRTFSNDSIRSEFLKVAGAVNPGDDDSVSVVVAAHGECPHLEATVEALAAQRGPTQAEILVVYDGDCSKLRERLKGVAGSLRVVSEPSWSLNAKRNRGIAEASCDRILFTDDDCVPDEGWVEAMGAALALHPVVTGAVLPLGSGVRASVRTGERPRMYAGLVDTVLFWRPGCGNNLGVRRGLLDSVGEFDPRIGVGTWSAAACDAEFLFRVLKARQGAVHYEPSAIVRHRQEPLGERQLKKRRGYYRGVSFMARRIHPWSGAAWASVALRIAGTAAATAWSALRLQGEARQIHAAELRGAIEGLFPPGSEVAANSVAHEREAHEREAHEREAHGSGGAAT